MSLSLEQQALMLAKMRDDGLLRSVRYVNILKDNLAQTLDFLSEHGLRTEINYELKMALRALYEKLDNMQVHIVREDCAYLTECIERLRRMARQ